MSSSDGDGKVQFVDGIPRAKETKEGEGKEGVQYSTKP